MVLLTNRQENRVCGLSAQMPLRMSALLFNTYQLLLEGGMNSERYRNWEKEGGMIAPIDLLISLSGNSFISCPPRLVIVVKFHQST